MQNTQNRPSRVVLNIEYYGPEQVVVPVDYSDGEEVDLETISEEEIHNYWHDLQGSAEEQRLTDDGDWVSREDWDTERMGAWEKIGTELVRSFPNVERQAMGFGA